MSLSVASPPVGDPVPKLKLDQSSGVTLNSQVFTAMIWAYHTGGTSIAYQDILSVRDSTIGGGDSDDQVVGYGLHVPGSILVPNLGDVDTDVDGSSDTELTPPTFPDNDCWLQVFNSRSSESDAGSVFIGHMAGLKVWSNVALTPAEIFAEMWSYWPVRRFDVWALVPMINKASAGFNYVGSDFTVQGAEFVDGVLDPPGVSWSTRGA
jgi:hypothetical protein